MASYDLSALRVLVVDDNAHMRHLVRTIVNAFGIRNVREASDGAGALECLAAAPSDIIITDLTMEPLNGLEFSRMIRRAPDSIDPTVPIIMLTAHSSRLKVCEARDAGVNEVAAKPIAVNNLFSRIVAVIERPRSFVRCETYVGPDRRRGLPDTGRRRRWDDEADAEVVDLGI